MVTPEKKKRPPTVEISDSDTYATVTSLAKNTRFSLKEYVNEILKDHIQNQAFLRRYAPHLSIHKIEKSSISVIDEHLNRIVNVELKDNRLWCSEDKPKACMHIFYVMGHPKIGYLVDGEQNNH